MKLFRLIVLTILSMSDLYAQNILGQDYLGRVFLFDLSNKSEFIMLDSVNKDINAFTLEKDSIKVFYFSIYENVVYIKKYPFLYKQALSKPDTSSRSCFIGQDYTKKGFPYILSYVAQNSEFRLVEVLRIKDTEICLTNGGNVFAFKNEEEVWGKYYAQSFSLFGNSARKAKIVDFYEDRFIYIVSRFNDSKIIEFNINNGKTYFCSTKRYNIYASYLLNGEIVYSYLENGGLSKSSEVYNPVTSKSNYIFINNSRIETAFVIK